tara:strand:- start:4028 stop:5458 length:1431 start_codon:yes stop_codon:yes gene_type:complete
LKLFENRLLAEGLRALESHSLTLLACIKKSDEKSFESLLIERAQNHEKCSEINDLFLHFNKIIMNTFYLLFVVVFILGGLAVNNVLFASPSVSVNFFWAFALFFIPNIFMFVVWLLFFMQPQWLQNGSLGKLFLMLIKQFERHFNKSLNNHKYYQPLFLCYFNIHFGNALGRYQLSKLTHLLWLGYFCGATLMSIVMLATHQVDFIWQTSILSSEAFQSLTNLLAYLPQKLSLPVPTVEQIQQGYFTTDNLLEAENRRLAWSSLLISSLFLYGLLPRLCLFLLMNHSLKNKKTNYQIDLTDSYYVRLRQILKPNKTTLGITDPDDDLAVNTIQRHVKPSQPEKNTLSDNHYAIAIELSEQQLDFAKQHLTSQHSKFVNEITNACDHQSQQSVIASLQNIESHEIVLYVSMNRLPDRGLKRFISELTAIPQKEFKLFMLVEKNHHQQRDSDWYQLAASVGIMLDNISHIEVGDVKHD